MILNKVGEEVNTLVSLEKAFDEVFQPIIVSNRGDQQHVWKSPQQKEHLTTQIQKLQESCLLKEESQIFSLTEKGTMKLQNEIKKIGKEKTKHRRPRRHEKKIEKLAE